jgi:DHA1 family tetracycline resistance protein-like MFS transporter
MTTPAPSAAPRRAAIPFILITVLLDTLGVGLIIPVGPRLVASFLDNDLERAAHWFGLLMSLYSLMQFVFAPVLGGLSDRFGRRTVILMSLAGAATSYLTSGLAPALWWLFIGRIVAGITGASFSAANAYIADITPPEKRAANFGLVGAVFGLGFILGPMLGGILGDYGLRVPYFVGAGLNFCNMVYGFFVLPESLPKESRRRFDFARANPIGSLGNLRKSPLVLRLTGTLACAFMAQMILQSTWALSSQARFGWNFKQVGMSFMAVGLSMAIVQGVVVRAVIPVLKEKKSLALGLAFGATGYALIGLATRGWMLYAFVPFLALGGIAGPAVQAIITHQVGPKQQGELQGAINSLQGLTAIVGPLIGTMLIARFGTDTSAIHVPGAPFFAACLFSALGLVLALRSLANVQITMTNRPAGPAGADAAPPSA